MHGPIGLFSPLVFPGDGEGRGRGREKNADLDLIQFDGTIIIIIYFARFLQLADCTSVRGNSHVGDSHMGDWIDGRVEGTSCEHLLRFIYRDDDDEDNDDERRAGKSHRIL